METLLSAFGGRSSQLLHVTSEGIIHRNKELDLFVFHLLLLDSRISFKSFHVLNKKKKKDKILEEGKNKAFFPLILFTDTAKPP